MSSDELLSEVEGLGEDVSNVWNTAKNMQKIQSDIGERISSQYSRRPRDQ